MSKVNQNMEPVAVVLLTLRLASVPGALDFLHFRRWDLASPAIQIVSIISSFFLLSSGTQKAAPKKNLLGHAI